MPNICNELRATVDWAIASLAKPYESAVYARHGVPNAVISFSDAPRPSLPSFMTPT